MDFKLLHTRAIIAILGVMLSIIAVSSSYFYKEHIVIILTIQAILAPAIYSIGNLFIEDKITESYEKTIKQIEKEYDELNEAYHGSMIYNVELENKFKKR